MAKILKPPDSLQFFKSTASKSIFLAGTIEMGIAEDWRKYIENYFINDSIIFLNPLRDTWDNTLEQKIENPVFRQQVEWELEALELADIIVMNFLPGTKSPISMLEFGLHARSQKLIVYCPGGFWRKGNIDIVCQKYNIKQVNDFDELIKVIKESANNYL